jgi:uncharacterized protein (TIGR02246 family)
MGSRIRRKNFCSRQLLLGGVFVSVTVSAKADRIRADYASNADDRKLVSKVVDNMVFAWNNNDADAIAKLFLPDGILIIPTGSVIRSRSEIRKHVSGERQGKLKAINKVSILNDGTALVEGMYQLKGMKTMGIETSSKGPFTIHHKKQQRRWMIAKAEILKQKSE